MTAAAGTRDLDFAMLRRAALAGLRGAGCVEPNPMVGCVIGREDGTVLAIGHHRRFGGLHAEAEALAECVRCGIDAKGATAWVTLEPCNAHGKQPPCSEALVRAGVKRVVYAVRDPNPAKAGGVERLRAAGIDVVENPGCPMANSLAASFIKRTTTGLPWVIAKWAQTIDGKIATRSGESKWISCPASRRRVHRLRARVDVVLTAIGTVLADDPLLTARGVPVRRAVRRVVIDPNLQIPMDSALVRSAMEAPLTIATCAAGPAAMHKRDELLAKGAEVWEWPSPDHQVPTVELLRLLVSGHGVSTVLVESGPGLMGRMFDEELVDEAVVFIAPIILGDPAAPSAVARGLVAELAGARRMSLARVRRVGSDAMLQFRK